MLAALLALVLSNGAPVAADTLNGPIKMKPSQIREYNRALSRDHPNYIRCTIAEETGSLVKRQSVCRTNQKWSRLATQGSENARELLDSMQKGWTRGDEPPSGSIRAGPTANGAKPAKRAVRKSVTLSTRWPAKLGKPATD